MKNADRIAKLEQQKAKINAEIQRVKASEQKEERKKDTRRKVLVGAMVLGMVESGQWPRERLLAALDQYLDREHDRALFDLTQKIVQEEKSGTLVTDQVANA